MARSETAVDKSAGVDWATAEVEEVNVVAVDLVVWVVSAAKVVT